MAVEFWIANTVSDLMQGDVLGQGTTTSIDTGELTFLHQPGGHFPYGCFSGHATAVPTPVDLAAIGSSQGRPWQELAL